MAGIASQVILSVLASTLIGGILGWHIRGRHLRQQAEAIEEEWRERLRAVQRERNACHESLEESAVRIKGLEADLERTLDALKTSGGTRRALERQVAELQQARSLARGRESAGLKARIIELESFLRRQKGTLSSLRSDLIAAREAEQPGAARIRTLNVWIRRLEEQLGRPPRRSQHRTENGTSRVAPPQERPDPHANGTRGSDGQSGSQPPT